MSPGFMLRCTRCASTYSNEGFLQLCPSCNGILNIFYDYEALKQYVTPETLQKRSFGIWKYSELLPITGYTNIVSLGEGGTFLHKCERLGRTLGLNNLYIKNETTNPTGSFIDRGTAVVVSKAREFGIRELTCGATGNLGASLAAYAAKASINCTVHLSSPIDQGKLYQMIAFGATIKPARTPEAAQINAQRIESNSLMVTPIDPFFLEGEKTTGLELCEQLDWQAPDRIIVPMGNGGHLSMIWKGLKELSLLDTLEDLSTNMIGVQAAGCSPILDAFEKGVLDVIPVDQTQTLVSDLGFKDPLMGHLAVKTLQESEGMALAVSDEKMLEAAHLLAKTEGIFAELAAASTIACVKRLVELEQIEPSEMVVCVITGMGLKDPTAMRRYVERARTFKRLVHTSEEQTFPTKMGKTKQLILDLLSNEEQYGYSVWQQLQQQFNISIKLPTVYQHLVDLERLSLIRPTKMAKAFGKPERKYYAITDQGRTILTAFAKMKVSI